jgi:hypothetical protein
MDSGLITSDGTKVLTVEEYDKFMQFIPARYKPAFEVDCITGMRYIELQRLHDNPNWYNSHRNQILLPAEAQRKVRTVKKKDGSTSTKQIRLKRTIDRLPSTFSYVFSAFVSSHRPPERTSWNTNLSRWSEKAGISPKIGPKTPRKTIESWMLKAGVPEIEVYARSGHDPVTSLKHYQSLSFTEYELRDINKRLAEWGILK